MKKNYVKPTVAVMKLNCEGVLCTSANIRYADPEESDVYDEEYNGTVL